MPRKTVVRLKSETEEQYSNDDLYNIMSWGADLSFRELIMMYNENELIKPELQRNYVWDKKEASRFIESILLGLPVPSVFFAKLKNNKYLIIDGFQRILTIYGYVNGTFMGDGKVFKLSNSEYINSRWRGKAFKELTEDERRRINTFCIHTIIFEQKQPKDDDTSLHQIFERINTGGRTLNAQEIRNCVSQGKLNSLLIELNTYPKWRELYGRPKPDPRMNDIEFILRFFALSSEEIEISEKKQISLKNVLDKYMNSSKNNDILKINELKKDFINTIDFIYDNLGINAFNNYSFEDKKFIERFHPTIYDSIMISTLKNISIGLDINNLLHRKMILLQNEDYRTYISERTTNVDHIRGRIEKASEILYG